MPRRPGVPVRQRRVSTELRRLRKEAGLTCADAARALDVSITKISRMETGERGLYADEVAALLGLYRVPAKLRQELLDLVRHGQDPNWWQMKPADLPAEWRDLIQLEKDATAIANFEPIVVPGLLQTAEYATAVMQGINDVLPERASNAMVATRMARQALLTTRNAPTLHAIIDEMVLRRPIGVHGVMHRQLHHLIACAQRPNITIQVVRVAAGATPALEGPIVLIDLPDGEGVVHLETRRAGGFLSEKAHVQAIRLTWQRLRAVALAPDKSVRLIAAIAGKETIEETR